MRVLHAGPDRRHARPAGAQPVADATPRSARRWPATCAAARATRRSSTRSGWRRRDPRGLRRRDGLRRRPSRRARRRSRATGSPPSALARRAVAKARGSTRSGCLATPGLINCHHHLYQWATRGLAQQATLFEWLVELYPTWARIDARVERAAARAGLAALLRSGCTTASDHHYVFPGAATCWGSRSRPRASSASASTRAAGRWTSASRRGGLPPDSVVEDRDAILAAYDDALNRFHDPSPGSMCRIALAPCSPFSVTRELMAETRGVRPLARRSSAHPHGRDRRGGGVLPGAVRRAAGRVPRGARLARRRRLARALRAPLRARGRALRRDAARASRTARRPTPGSARGSRRWCRSCARARRSGSASTARPPTRRASWAASCARRCWSRGCAAGRRR